MSAKPIKRGIIKVWCSADAHNGYICEVQVYMGKSDLAESGLGKRIVLDLARRLEGKKYHLYFDNLFSSLLSLCLMHCWIRDSMPVGQRGKTTVTFLMP